MTELHYSPDSTTDMVSHMLTMLPAMVGYVPTRYLAVFTLAQVTPEQSMLGPVGGSPLSAFDNSDETTAEYADGMISNFADQAVAALREQGATLDTMFLAVISEDAAERAEVMEAMLTTVTSNPILETLIHGIGQVERLAEGEKLSLVLGGQEVHHGTIGNLYANEVAEDYRNHGLEIHENRASALAADPENRRGCTRR